MKKYLLSLGLTTAMAATLSMPAQAADAVMGLWMVQSGNAIVEIAPCGDEACGSIVWLKEPNRDGAPKVDINNPDEALRSRAICGLDMVGGFQKKAEGDWQDGFIYNAEDGKTYTAFIKAQDDGTLKLRGYVGVPLFGKTQIWTRAADNQGGC